MATVLKGYIFQLSYGSTYSIQQGTWSTWKYKSLAPINIMDQFLSTAIDGAITQSHPPRILFVRDDFLWLLIETKKNEGSDGDGANECKRSCKRCDNARLGWCEDAETLFRPDAVVVIVFIIGRSDAVDANSKRDGQWKGNTPDDT